MLIKGVSFCLGKLSILIDKILQWSHLCKLNQSYERFPQNIFSYFKVYFSMEVIVGRRLKVKHYSKKKK